MEHNYLALDLGAESGRAIHGTLCAGKLSLTETHRFPSGYIDILGHYYWDIARIFDELKKGIEITRISKQLNFESIGIDTWGVDFGILAGDGYLAGLPFSYRDHHTDNAITEFEQKVMPRKELYLKTGLQLMQCNTIFQLFALRQAQSPQLSIATDLLFMPDLLNYFFTGVKKAEFTIASTSQLMNLHNRKWNSDLFKAIGIPEKWMQEIVQPGEIIGNISPSIAHKAGILPIPVVAVPSHDSQSAIAAIPAKGNNWAYLSSGTWSVMGIEVDKPIIDEVSEHYGFTNEGGVEGTFCFMKNLNGLWLLQECKKIWDLTHKYSYNDLTTMASEVENLGIYIDTNTPEFYNPTNMQDAIADYCEKTGQKIPENHAQFTRCIFNNLALKYLQTLNQIREISGKTIDELHVIGGGSKNELLCQLTANSLRIPVIAGPAEATAMGNLLYQAKGFGHVVSIAEIRNIVCNSFETITYYPQESEKWKICFEKYTDILKSYS